MIGGAWRQTIFAEEDGHAWDVDVAAERAADALSYLNSHYPEAAEHPRVFDAPERAANAAAMRGDWEAYIPRGSSRVLQGRP